MKIITIDPIKPANSMSEAEAIIFKGKLVVQRKFNGCRCTGTFSENGPEIWSRSISTVTGERIPYTGKFPHIIEEMAEWNLPPGTMLDGELVSLRGGDIENFTDVKQSTGGHDLTNAMFQKNSGHFCTWMIFDIPIYGGREVHKLPCKDRIEILNEIFKGHNFKWIRKVESIPFEGTVEAYMKQAEEKKWEGFVAKNIDSPYPLTISGKTRRPSGTWWKIKPKCMADVIVTGFEHGAPGTAFQNTVAKLICVQYDTEGKLHEVCKVGTGFDVPTRDFLLTVDYKRRPVGMVEYSYRNDNHKVIHPSWKGFRDDKRPEECIIEELQ
jgi:bifunctional non-homologous end joining protein LigD